MRFHALLSATLPLLANGQAQLLPVGEFAGRGHGQVWSVDDARGRELAAALNAIAAQTPVVIDYEHQTLHAKDNGQRAPAAGWIKHAVWRDGEGLFADQVEWTAAARTAIDAGEYRYLSPVITYDKAGHVTGVLLAALTNYPAILGMDAVVAALDSLGARLPPHLQETHDMTLLQQLIAALELRTETTEAAALSAATRLFAEAAQLRVEVAALKSAKAVPVVPAALVAELGLAAGADEAAALTAVKSLKSADTGTMAIVTGLQSQVAALTAQLNEAGLVQLVDGAIAANKFVPAHRDWLLAQGRKDLAALKAAIEAAPVIPGLAGQSAGGKDVPDETAALTGMADEVRRNCGLSAEQWAKGAPLKKAA